MSIIQTRERIHYFDIAKGLLILLLLIHHFSSATRISSINNSFFPIVTSWGFVFTAFFMQCFFIISGYCSNFDEDTLTFFKKVVKQLIVPWIVFELLQATFWAIYYSDFTIERYRLFFFTVPNTTLWFINALVFSKIVVFILKKYMSFKLIFAITFLMLLGAIVINELNLGNNYIAIRESMGSCFFVALGCYMKKNQNIYDKLMKYSPYIYIVLLVVLKLLKLRIPVYAAGIHVSINTFPIFFILSITGTFAFLRLCKWINLNRVLEYFGKNSLIVYGLHFCPLYAFVVLYYNILPPSSFWELIVYLVMVYVSELVVVIGFVQLFQLRWFKWVIGKY